uniref:Uncharacterized protein n=1 Tax=Cajanus cajan TaxID=3821 RepID=A0A151T601_CAJCA|nr:hypothetical protein KK1_017018 [Cajanus cajan]
MSPEHTCKVEYEVEPCNKGYNSSACIDVKRTSLPMKTGGYVIYGVGHQHAGAIGSTLYGQEYKNKNKNFYVIYLIKKLNHHASFTIFRLTIFFEPIDGKVICSSIAKYGNGTEAGNEKGYVVGMSTCYPKPGTVKIRDGETLTLEVIYNSNERHTGVMGLFYFLVAEHLPH